MYDRTISNSASTGCCCRWRRGGRLSSRLLHDLQRRTALACCVCDPGAWLYLFQCLLRACFVGLVIYVVGWPACCQPQPINAQLSSSLPHSIPRRRVALHAAGAAAAACAGGARPAAVQPVSAGRDWLRALIGTGRSCWRQGGGWMQATKQYQQLFVSVYAAQHVGPALAPYP